MKFLLIFLMSLNLSAKTLNVWIIDTGIDLSHKEISSHIPKTEDLDSFNYRDFNGHGTHVSGLITKDLCPQVQIHSCKYYFERYEPKMQTSNDCFALALKNHADYINFSSGGPSFDRDEENIVKLLLKSGTIIVSAAGNNGTFQDQYYLPSYGLKKIIVVGNLNQDGTRHWSSNYGYDGMVWEIGTNIWSTLANGKMGFMSGSSQAAALRMNRILRGECDRIKNH